MTRAELSLFEFEAPTEDGGIARGRSLPVSSWEYTSGDDRYRWKLGRAWSTTVPVLGVVMLNPSTASALVADPTLRRVMALAKGAGFGGVEIANLYGLRSADPRVLKACADPVGADNDVHLRAVCGRLDVVCAWGASGTGSGNPVKGPKLRERVAVVRAFLAESGSTSWTWGVTKGGHPRHPLYLPASSQLVRWTP